jgi:uncharacterized membrane protein YjgN (DUF898 family)
VVLIGMGFVTGLLSALIGRYDRPLAVLPIIVFEFVVLVLALSAPFSAQRYRLGHTLWRGIRGGMEGSAIQYGLRAMAYILLAAVTLYQLLPWATLRLRERLISASYLGDLRLHASGRPGQLYLIFLATFAGVILLGIAVAGTIMLLGATDIHAMIALSGHARGAPQDPALSRMAQHAIYWIIAGYLVFGLGAVLISCAYTAAFWRHLLSHTTAGAINFGSRVAARDVFLWSAATGSS